uniref:SpoIIE family protein phosphatase n=1 Tax=Kineococcus sp. SYSU DK005 TaxID=3383126 RepID=UPI003D7C8132
PPRPMLGLGFGPTTGLDAETVRLPLPADALLLLYSDGLVERRESGLAETTATLARAATAAAAHLRREEGMSALADHLLTAVPGGAGDDTTLVLVRPDRERPQE